MPSAHFSKPFLASLEAGERGAIPPTDRSTAFERVESNIVGGFSGLLAIHRTIQATGMLPEGVVICQEDVK